MVCLLHHGEELIRGKNKEGNLMIDENRLNILNSGERVYDSNYNDQYNHGRQLFRQNSISPRQDLMDKINIIEITNHG